MRTCQLDECENSLEGMMNNAKYCCDQHRNRHKARLWYEPRRKSRVTTCQLVGCDNSILGTHGNKRYCCKEHRYKDYSIKNKKPRKFYICQLDSCNKSLEGMGWLAKYCCKQHKEKAYRKTSQFKSYIANKKRTRKHLACLLVSCDNSLEGMGNRAKYCCEPHRAKFNWINSKGKRKERNQTKEYKARRRAAYHRRAAKERALPAAFTDTDWQYALDYFDNRCAYCGSGGELHQEHFIPLVRGGSYTPDNIIPSCPSCNFSKSKKDPQDWCTTEQHKRVMQFFRLAKGKSL